MHRDDLPLLTFVDAESLRRWLDEQGETSPGAWLRFAKQGAPEPTVRKSDAIDCALAYGWVDGQLGSIDAHYLKTRFSPAAAQKCLVPNRSLRSRTSGAGRSHAFSGASAS